MKVSISLPAEDIEFLDAYVKERGFNSRSAVLHRAVRLLRGAELGAAYEAAWAEWASEDGSHLWEQTSADGLTG